MNLRCFQCSFHQKSKIPLLRRCKYMELAFTYFKTIIYTCIDYYLLGGKLMTQWEYDHRKINACNLVRKMDDLEEIGLEGWELVLIEPGVDDDGMANAISKRQKE